MTHLLLALIGLMGTGVLALGLTLLVRRAQLQTLSRGARVYRLVLPAEFAPEAVEQLLLALHGLLRRPLPRLLLGQPWFTLEGRGEAGAVELRLVLSDAVPQELASRHLEAALPGARLEPVEEDRASASAEASAHLLLRGSGLLRVKTPTPGLAGLVAGLRGLQRGERAVLQLLIQPLSPGAQRRLLTQAGRLLAGHREGERRLAPTLAERALAQRLQAKAAVPLFGVAIRLHSEAPTHEAARRLLGPLAAGFHQFGTAELHFARRPVWFPRLFARAFAARRLPLLPAPRTLNATELASLLAVTPEIAREAGLPTVRGRALAPSPEIPRQGRQLGVSVGADGTRPVALSVDDSRRHLHVIGPTGTGKTTLVVNLAAQDMRAGAGVVVFDPKGDLVDALLAQLPPEREDDLIVFDPVDQERPIGVNLLELRPGDEPELVCDHLVAVFRGLYQQFWGPRTDDILRAAILTLLHEPGATLCEVPLLLTDDAFRARYLARLDDPVALEPFWAWYEGLSAGGRAEAIGPVSNKLRAFLLQRRLRNIVGQSRSTLDFDQVLAERKILLVSLAKGLVGEEAAALLGSFLVAKLWQATLRRAALPADARPDAFCFVDELQDYLRLPTSLEDVLAQARSFRLNLTLAHQHLGQLPPALRQGVLANARSRIVFQPSATDARVLAREFEPYLGERDLRALAPYEIAATLAVGGGVTRPFTAQTLPPPAPRRDDLADLRAASRTRYGRPRAAVESEIRRRLFPETTELPHYGRRDAPSARPTDRASEEGRDAA